MFTNANSGINAATFTKISCVFTAPTTGTMMALEMGQSGNTVPPGIQTAGTVQAYGWAIEFYNNTTNLMGNLATTGNLTVNGTSSVNAAGTFNMFDSSTTPVKKTYIDGAGNLSISGYIKGLGQITAAYPVNLVFYGTPLIYFYNSATAASPTTSTSAFYYLKWSSNQNNNWTPAYTGASNTQLTIPFTGLYAVSMTLSLLATCEMFISRNLCNNSDINIGDGRLLCSNFTTPTAISVNTGATCYLTAGDFVNFGFVLEGGTLSMGTAPRNVAQITLTQRTA